MQARLLHWQIARWAEIARDREHARSEVIRYFWVLRAYVLRAGELTGLGDDIFFLDADEIVDGPGRRRAGSPGHRRAASDLRSATGAARYPALISGPFDPFAWAADPDRRTDLFAGRIARCRPRRPITGFPGSAGVVEGTARVLSAAHHGHLLQPGEVLVTSVTNVGWTPIFPRAAAVVTDVGRAAVPRRDRGPRARHPGGGRVR